MIAPRMLTSGVHKHTNKYTPKYTCTHTHGVCHSSHWAGGRERWAGREWERSTWSACAPNYKCIHIWVKGWWEGDGSRSQAQLCCRDSGMERCQEKCNVIEKQIEEAMKEPLDWDHGNGEGEQHIRPSHQHWLTLSQMIMSNSLLNWEAIRQKRRG